MKNFNAIKILLDMPVMYIAEDNSSLLDGHFAGYDIDGYGYVFDGGSTLMTADINRDLIKCKLIKIMDTKSQGVYNHEKSVKFLDKLGYNIINKDGRYFGVDINTTLPHGNKKDSKRTMLGYSPQKMSINDPVLFWTDNPVDNSKPHIAHFAGYDEEGHPYIYEQKGTSYTRSYNDQYIKVDNIGMVDNKDTRFVIYEKLVDKFTDAEGVIVGTDGKLILNDEPTSELAHNNHNKNLYGINVINANLTKATFINVNLSKVLFANVNLSNTKIENANIKNLNIVTTVEDIMENLKINGMSIGKLELLISKKY